MNYEQTFKEIYNDLQHVEESGHVADYITELAQVDLDQFGVHLTTVEQEEYSFGDAEKRFSVQSVNLKFTKKSGQSLGIRVKTFNFAVN